MKSHKQIVFVIGEIVILIGIAVGCYYSETVRWIMLCLLALVVIAFFILKRQGDNNNSHLPEKIWGKDWQRLVDEGKLSTTKPYKCRTNRRYSDRKEIEKCSGVPLPNFKVLNCEETLRKPISRYDSFIGDYSGFMDIEFKKDIPELSKQKIKSIPSPKWSHLVGTQYRCVLADTAFCKWNIALALDSRIARIEYCIKEK